MRNELENLFKIILEDNFHREATEPRAQCPKPASPSLTYTGPVGWELEARGTLAAVAAWAVDAVRVSLAQVIPVAALVNIWKGNSSIVSGLRYCARATLPSRGRGPTLSKATTEPTQPSQARIPRPACLARPLGVSDAGYLHKPRAGHCNWILLGIHSGSCQSG